MYWGISHYVFLTQQRTFHEHIKAKQGWTPDTVQVGIKDLQTYRQQLMSGPTTPRAVSCCRKGRLSLQLRIKASKVQHEGNNHLSSSWRITYQPILLKIHLLETWGKCPKSSQRRSTLVSFKHEEDMLGSCSLPALNWDGEESQLFNTIAMATKIHSRARMLENGIEFSWRCLSVGCRLQQ